MKTTGISRRIDNLGRIVIPKEIRKSLKIRDGEMMEISIQDEQIILTKSTTMRGIKDIAKLCVDAINDTLDISMIITDRDRIIATSPSLRKKYLDTDLSVEMSEMLLKRDVIIENESKSLKINNYEEERASYLVQPIIADGDIVGSIIILGLDNKISDIDEKVASFISKFLMRNIL
ncbi:MAG: stage V sporulation T C-terminal domain-containing protein [Bacilli bacterium]|nr:stage V sporulation T C-terminal domain-containing protein [Bacilli bacterium]MDD4298032.1 stage V sporulation T C-terminal domain-containing protein [Bacilli bacterium]MDD4643684.1 stage V sporulation T C-terminal domain-containing protein [Bacilli bacterium]